MLPPGSTVYCVLKHVSRSGMQREIGLYTLDRASGDVRWLSGYARTALGWRLGKRDGIIANGCGMDMGFHLVSSLAYQLYPEGFGCIGENRSAPRRSCPSNDHWNGDRDYRPHHAECGAAWGIEPYPHWHRSGDYALRSEWL